MIRIVALGAIALSLMFELPANAAEGKVAQRSSTTIDAQRDSSYIGGSMPADTLAAPRQPDAKSRARLHVSAGKTLPARKIARAAAVMQSADLSNFYIYDAFSTLRLDRDDDGYHSEFEVRFDADSLVGGTYVYARLYLRRAGESEWFLYHETGDFRIDGQTPDDQYYVITTLDAGYPSDGYDVLIDLYESGRSGIVATFGPLDSAALSNLPLEEAGLDLPFGIAGYSIRDVSTELILDADGDGHYSRFRIAFDPDADFDSRLVYARVWARPRGGAWIEEHVTADFPVQTGGQADVYVLDVEWRSGYPTAYYDFQIDLHDAATDLLVASAGSERLALAQVPLEDRSRDQYVGPPAPGSGGSNSSREGGGGAWGLLPAIGLLLLLGWRRLRS